MNIQEEKIHLAKLLLETEDQNTINSIKEIFSKNEIVDFWDELSVEQKNEIENASIEIQKGEVTDYDSFIQKHR
jgi:hypothetical protein